MSDVYRRAQEALWNQFRTLSKSSFDDAGYVRSPEMNLLPGITMDLFEEALNKADGQELKGDRPKFNAIHSSAALAVNSFAFWKGRQETLAIMGESGFKTMRFECKCPTGLGGSPPNLDVVLEKSSKAIGVESKFLEPLRLKRAKFEPSYCLDRLPQMEPMWWQLLEDSKNGAPQYLDIAQLIKHYLGLRATYPDSQVVLVYLYWEPDNAAAIQECLKHRAEIQTMRERISNSAAAFIPITYKQLWEEWAKIPTARDHVENLRRRYLATI